MKALINICCICSVAALLSCGEDFLDLSPQSQISASDFYQTAEDMTTAVDAAYSSLATDGQYDNLFNFMEIRSDNTSGDGGNAFDNFSLETTDALLGNTWRDHYNGIARCNVVIERIGSVPMDTELKDQYVGEAKFLRALMYFNLVRLFGDVPLVLEEVKTGAQSLTYGRSPAAAVYDTIVADLLEVAPQLPVSYTGVDIGRATQGAAKSLLGKIYLTTGQFQDAAAILKEVIDLGVYDLLPNYAAIFEPLNSHHAESIFEVHYKSGGLGLGSPFTSVFARRGDFVIVFNVGSGNDQNIPTQDFLDAYETRADTIADLRYYASMDTGYVDTEGEFVRQNFVKKYLFPQPQARDGDANWPVLRYADVLLMYAEAVNEVNKNPTTEAYEYVNRIRQRAGLEPLTGLDYQTFAEALQKERRLELAFENHRWPDLLRTGRALQVMNQHFQALDNGITVQEYQLLYPIPRAQIDINSEKMQQNPGYN